MKHMTGDLGEETEHSLPDHEDVNTALSLAKAAHRGQKDKAGHHYIGHPIRVARAAWVATGNIDATVVALLHDTLEDTYLTVDDLLQAGITPRVIEAVDAISRREGERPEQYYARVRSNSLSAEVKQHDIADNSAPARLALLDPATRARLEKKYAKARELLQQPALGSEEDSIVADTAGWLDIDPASVRSLAKRPRRHRQAPGLHLW